MNPSIRSLFGFDRREALSRCFKLQLAAVIAGGLCVIVVSALVFVLWLQRDVSQGWAVSGLVSGTYGAFVLVLPLIRTRETMRRLATPHMSPISSTGGHESYVENPELIRAMAEDRARGLWGAAFLMFGFVLQLLGEFFS